MFGECHAHIFMNGTDYHRAVQTHKVKADEVAVRSALDAYRKAGVAFVREGGDPYGASLLADWLLNMGLSIALRYLRYIKTDIMEKLWAVDLIRLRNSIREYWKQRQREQILSRS